jgi:RNA polymerase sigma factor (sigma-70 family)
MDIAIPLNLQETDIIDACVRQERWAQQALYEAYFPVLMGVCLRYASSSEEAMDLLHDGFIKIFQKIHLYAPQASLKSWMARIIINTAIDHFRRSKRQHHQDIEEASHIGSDDPTVIQQLSEKEILSCIQKLPPVYRSTFNLFVMEGYSHKEIGEMLGTTESTSRSNLVKARNKLKTLIDQLHNSRESHF